ncbi:hypothetical protein GGI20_006133 [Coemansia sp. BCRC 34301]|nr:hypothetical protein GGI20_006133 [Coemansia sp. BCRC 34301]
MEPATRIKDPIFNRLSHLRAYFELCYRLEERGAKIPHCFPLRTSFIISHFHLTDEIIVCNILGGKYSRQAKLPLAETWGQLINLHSPALRLVQDENMIWRPKPGHVYEFAQSADSDGVSISLCFKTADAKAKLKTRGIAGAATRARNRADLKSSGAELAATTDVSTVATTDASTVATMDASTSGKKVRGKRKRNPAAKKPANDYNYIHDVK